MLQQVRYNNEADYMTTSTTTAPLMWAPPTMNNPTIIDLSKTGGQDWWQFSPTQDVIFIGADTVRTADKLQTQGGHNIMVLGGEYQPTGSATGTMSFYGVTNEVFVDGVHIDNKNSHSGMDGIDISGGGAQPNLVIQNSLIENINGAKSAGHADMVQTQGTAGDIKMYNVSGTTNYQGLFLAPQYQPETKSAELHNVNISYTGPTTNDGSAISYLVWTLDDPKTEKAYPITFDNVYVAPRDGQQAIEAAVWPKAELGATQNGNEISWPSLPYKGSVTVGTHANFADSTTLGLNFKDGQALADAASHGVSVPTSGTTGGTGGTPTTAPVPAPVSDPTTTPAPVPAPAPTPDTSHTGSATPPANDPASIATMVQSELHILEQMVQKLVDVATSHGISLSPAAEMAAKAMAMAASPAVDSHHVHLTHDHWHA
jgi:hypothetical protein